MPGYVRDFPGNKETKTWSDNYKLLHLHRHIKKNHNKILNTDNERQTN